MLRRDRENSMILVEAGASTTVTTYDPSQQFKIDYTCAGENPIDTLVLSVV